MSVCLENVVKLYVTVRCFSFTKDIVNKYELRDRSLFVARVGAEEKVVGTQKNMLPHLPLGQILLHPTLERQQKKIHPKFFSI